MSFQYYGIDGCRGGWLVASLNSQGMPQYHLYRTIQTFISSLSQNDKAKLRIFIDIPIGIPIAEHHPRTCDREAKQLLQHRHSTIFTVPCREALYAPSYKQGLRIQRELINKGFSIQTWNICPKIREVDLYLRSTPQVKTQLFESHPELCFMGINHNIPLSASKHTKDGILHRQQLLQKYWHLSNNFWKNNLTNQPNRSVQLDDLLDASILLLAAKSSPHHIVSIPQPPLEFDSFDTAMQISYLAL